MFIVSAVSPMVIGFKSNAVDEIKRDEFLENPAFYRFDEHNYPEGYSSNKRTHAERAYDVMSDVFTESGETTSNPLIEKKESERTQTAMSGDPMDSPWPMFMHDVRHTGRSPYSTADNPYDEKWYFTAHGLFIGSTIIDDEGIIYICLDDLFAIYSNGTLKWKYDDWYGTVDHAAPAIDENGTIYVGRAYNSINSKNFYALYPNGTVKWIYPVGGDVFSSPAIGDDGVIYFGGGKNFYAVYPNGTLKWKYITNHLVFSSPAIADDGTIYGGSIDDYVYAWYPNNGTVKWKFNTGAWVHGSATIGDDGTVYIGSDNSLYALYPNNGTMKWRCNVGAIWGSPTLDVDGTIYVGVWEEKFYAIYPNGTIKWTYDAPGRIWFGLSAALSADGTIYFGTTWMDGGEGAFIVLNPDGSEKWRYEDGGWYVSSPAIGEDGTVYVVSDIGDNGYLRAFGKLDSSAPDAPDIDGQTNGRFKRSYDYTFTTSDPNGDDVYYYIEWGDSSVEKWIGPYSSGEEITLNHTWEEKGTYTIRARAKDTDNLWGAWGELEVTMPKNKTNNFNFNLLSWLLERFPRMFPMLRLLFDLN